MYATTGTQELQAFVSSLPLWRSSRGHARTPRKRAMAAIRSLRVASDCILLPEARACDSILSMTDLTGNTFIEGPAGRLEALLKEPEGLITRAAIVCHPHPLFGGTMHNKVVYRIAKAFQMSGSAVLRFNFRGAGKSEGEHANGTGEQDDLRAAISFVLQRHTGVELWLAGFSFGAAVMLRAASDDSRIRAFVAAGAPVSKYDLREAESCVAPKLFVQGSLDQFGSVDDLRKFFDRLKDPKELRIIEGADHFFEGRLDELGQAVTDFIASHLDQSA